MGVRHFDIASGKLILRRRLLIASVWMYKFPSYLALLLTWIPLAHSLMASKFLHLCLALKSGNGVTFFGLYQTWPAAELVSGVLNTKLGSSYLKGQCRRCTLGPGELYRGSDLSNVSANHGKSDWGQR